MNINECNELQLTGDLKGAEICYRKLMKEENVSSEVLCNLGIICAKTEREEEATNLFKKIINLEPNSSIAYNNLALILIHNRSEQLRYR